MTRSEAIQAMYDGKKVTHHFFSKDEWMTISPSGKNKILTEDGYIHEWANFWRYREIEMWDDGYSLYQEPIIL